MNDVVQFGKLSYSISMILKAPTLDEIRKARINISEKAIKTPLIKLNYNVLEEGGIKDNFEDNAEIYLKLENLQRIGSFKVRAAANAIAELKVDNQNYLEEHGVCTASAGNFAQGLAWCCQEMGIKCVVVCPSHAPETKIKAMQRLGATVIKVSYSDWWEIIQSHVCSQAPDAYFIHPGAENSVLAGNATIGLEIVEEMPDVDAIIAPYGSGALCTGIATCIRALEEAENDENHFNHKCKIFSVEPKTAAPFCLSKRLNKPSNFENFEPSFVDGCGGKNVLEEIWPLARDAIDEGLEVEIQSVSKAIQILVERNRIVAEGAGAATVAAALDGLCGKGLKKIVCIVSGGGLDTKHLIKILQGETP